MARSSKFCIRCGAALHEGERFCAGCGQAVGQGEGQPAPPAAPPPPAPAPAAAPRGPSCFKTGCIVVLVLLVLGIVTVAGTGIYLWNNPEFRAEIERMMEEIEAAQEQQRQQRQQRQGDWH